MAGWNETPEFPDVEKYVKYIIIVGTIIGLIVTIAGALK